MELFRQAVTIMVLGMSLVFVFLAVVILCVQATAKAVRTYEARHPAADSGERSGETGGALAAAIVVALREQQPGGPIKG